MPQELIYGLYQKKVLEKGILFALLARRGVEGGWGWEGGEKPNLCQRKKKDFCENMKKKSKVL